MLPKTPAGHRLQLLGKLRGDIKKVEKLFVQQRKELKEEGEKKLSVLHSLHKLTKLSAERYTAQAGQLQRLATESKPTERRRGDKGCNLNSLPEIMLNAFAREAAREAAQEALVVGRLADDYEELSRLVKDRINAVSLIYKRNDEAAAMLHSEVRDVISAFENAQMDFLASSEQLVVSSGSKSWLESNLAQGSMCSEEEDEMQEKIGEKNHTVAHFQQRCSSNFDLCNRTVTSANAAVDKLAENMSDLARCLELGEEPWLEAILGRLEASNDKRGPHSKLVAIAAEIRKLRNELKSAKAAGVGGEKGRRNFCREHFHVRRLPHDNTSRPDVSSPFTANSHEHEIAILKSEQKTTEDHIGQHAADINALWRSGAPFKPRSGVKQQKRSGNERGLISTIRPQNLLRRWKAKRSPAVDDADDTASIGEQEAQHGESGAKEAAPLPPPLPPSSGPVIATAPPEELVGGAKRLDKMVGSYMELINEYVRSGNRLAQLQALNERVQKARHKMKAAVMSRNAARMSRFGPVFAINVNAGEDYASEDGVSGTLPHISSSASTATARNSSSQDGEEEEEEGEEDTNGYNVGVEGADSESTDNEVASNNAPKVGSELPDERAKTPTCAPDDGNSLSGAIGKTKEGPGFGSELVDNTLRESKQSPGGEASKMLTDADGLLFSNGSRLTTPKEAPTIFGQLPIGGQLTLLNCKHVDAKSDSAETEGCSRAGSVVDRQASGYEADDQAQAEWDLPPES